MLFSVILLFDESSKRIPTSVDSVMLFAEIELFEDSSVLMLWELLCIWLESMRLFVECLR